MSSTSRTTTTGPAATPFTPSSASGSWASTTWPRPARARSRSRSPRTSTSSPPTTPEGQPTPVVRALLDRGQSVIGFDPLLIGESHDPAAQAGRRPSTVHYETYNRTLAADRAQDLATVLAWAKSLPDATEVSLVA